MLQKYKLPLILALILALPIVVGQHIPLEVKSFLYAFSLTIKEVLVFVLPGIIFSFLFYSLISLKQRAVLFIILLLVMVATSNFIAICTGYSIGSLVLPHLQLNMAVEQFVPKLEPMWEFSIPKLVSNEPAIFFGIVSGLFFALRPTRTAEKFAKKASEVCIYFLRKIFMPILPLFILGFVLKLEQEDVLHRVFNVYGSVLVLVVSSQILYTCMLYYFASGFKFSRMLGYIRNILPATITGFSTISSAATMPITIMCTEKNIKSSNFARMIIPATANIHTLGSALGLTMLALSTLIAFGHGLPDPVNFFIFAFYYTMAKFAVAGIPGGVVIVVAPLLEVYLGFTSEMIGLITAVYLLFDPFGTATNVTCNGAFAIVFNKIYKSQEFAQEISTQSEQAA